MDGFTIKFKGILGASIEFHDDMTVNQFIVGLVAPFVITVLIPLTIGVVIGSFAFVIYSLLMAMGCGSDMLTFFRVLKYRGWNCYDPGVTGIAVYRK